MREEKKLRAGCVLDHLLIGSEDICARVRLWKVEADEVCTAVLRQEPERILHLVIIDVAANDGVARFQHPVVSDQSVERRCAAVAQDDLVGCRADKLGDGVAGFRQLSVPRRACACAVWDGRIIAVHPSVFLTKNCLDRCHRHALISRIEIDDRSVDIVEARKQYLHF